RRVLFRSKSLRLGPLLVNRLIFSKRQSLIAEARSKIMAGPSLKRLQIDKEYSTMLIVLAACVFLTIFSLLSSKTLLSQMFYQNRVISAKGKSLTQLKADVTAEQQL